MQKFHVLKSQSFSWALVVAIAISLFPFSFPHSDAGAVSMATRAGRLAVFDDVWQTVNDRYYDRNFHGVDWMDQRSIFRPLAANARGTQEFYAELRHMLALLKDAHTRVYSEDEKFDWQHPRFVSAGFSLREVEAQPTVVAVEPESEAARAGVRPGDIIESIDGEPVSAVLDRRLGEQIGSSTPQAARLRALTSLTEGPPETSAEIGWRAV